MSLLTQEVAAAKHGSYLGRKRHRDASVSLILTRVMRVPDPFASFFFSYSHPSLFRSPRPDKQIERYEASAVDAVRALAFPLPSGFE